MNELLEYSSVLLVASPVFVLAFRHSLMSAAISALTASGLLFIPINGVSVILQLKGVFADLSLTTVALLTIWPLLRVTKIALSGSDAAWLCAVVAIFALALYPMALGVGAYDPYALGYQPLGLLTLVAALGIVAVVKSHWVGVAIVITVLSGYWLKVLPSQNLWDYLLDPLLVIFAVTYLLQYLYHLYGRQIWRRSKGTPHST